MADTAVAPDVDVSIVAAAEKTAAELASTLPSGEVAIDASSSTSAAMPPSMPTPSKTTPVGAALAALPNNTDAFLGHLMRCLKTRAGTDVVLQFLCYSFRLSGSVLETLSRSALRLSARKLVALAFALPPATTVVLSSAPAPTGAALALKLATQFKSMSALLSEARTINRLWGLLGFYFALKGLITRVRAKKSDSEKASSDSVVEARLNAVFAFTQIIVIIFYQAFENLAFLGSKKVLDIAPMTQGKLALLSVRCWGTYTFMELGRLLLERTRKISTGEAAKDSEWATSWTKSFTRNLAWAPLTVQWSMPTGGPLPDIVISLLAMYPSASQMIDLWRETAAV